MERAPNFGEDNRVYHYFRRRYHDQGIGVIRRFENRVIWFGRPRTQKPDEITDSEKD